MISPRLAELLRQRKLVRDHLAWLDREIHNASASAPETGSPSVASPVTGSPPITTPLASPDMPPQPDPVGAVVRARRGCFVIAALAALFAIAALATIYFVRYRDHPLIFMDEHAAPERP